MVKTYQILSDGREVLTLAKRKGRSLYTVNLQHYDAEDKPCGCVEVWDTTCLGALRKLILYRRIARR